MAKQSQPGSSAPDGSPPPLPHRHADYLPLLLLPGLGLGALAIMIWQGVPFSTWVTLSMAALAMGAMIFVVASGLTLIFGLMDVINFGHGAFIAVGAYVAMTVFVPLADWLRADSILLNIAALALAFIAAMIVAGILGWAFERVVVMPVYGQHLKQILVTTGGLIVVEQLV